MRAIGVVVEPRAGRPKVHCSVLEVDWSVQVDPQLIENFTLQAPAGFELPQALGDLNRQFRARCMDLMIDAVWIWHVEPKAQAKAGTTGSRTRSNADGALAAAATEQEREVRLVASKSITTATGISKVDTMAAGAVAAGGVSGKSAEAAGAAFAALHALKP